MGNLSYAHFRNTLQDLRDCYENMYDDDLGEEEAAARLRLIKLCVEIAEEYEHEVQPELEAVVLTWAPDDAPKPA